MDRYHRKKDSHKAVREKCGVRNAECGINNEQEKNLCKFLRAGIIVLLSGIFLISLMSPILHAETRKDEERKIELEKVEIFGILERPNVLFPIRWKDPEGPEEKAYKPQRSFEEEIFDFVDMETIKGSRVRGQGSR